MKQIDVSSINTLFSSIESTGKFYNFKYRCSNKLSQIGLIKDHIFVFSNFKNEKFQANLHEYDIGLFAVKFYSKKHKLSKDKYSLLTNNGDAMTILKTMVAIMIYTLNQYPNHSFCFIGNASKDEQTEKTKRFKVYSRIMQRYFSTDNFSHTNDTKISLYSMINKKSNVQLMASKIANLAQKEIIDRGNNNDSVSLARNTK